MAYAHGKDAVFKVQDSGGTTRDLSAYLTSITYDPNADVAEVSTLGDSSKEYLAGLKDATITIEGKYDPAANGPDDVLNGILGGASRTFEFHPQGTATGKPKYTGSLICTGYSVNSPLEDASTFTATFQVTGAVTRGTN